MVNEDQQGEHPSEMTATMTTTRGRSRVAVRGRSQQQQRAKSPFYRLINGINAKAAATKDQQPLVATTIKIKAASGENTTTTTTHLTHAQMQELLSIQEELRKHKQRSKSQKKKKKKKKEKQRSKSLVRRILTIDTRGVATSEKKSDKKDKRPFYRGKSKSSSNLLYPTDDDKDWVGATITVNNNEDFHVTATTAQYDDDDDEDFFAAPNKQILRCSSHGRTASTDGDEQEEDFLA